MLNINSRKQRPKKKTWRTLHIHAREEPFRVGDEIFRWRIHIWICSWAREPPLLTAPQAFRPSFPSFFFLQDCLRENISARQLRRYGVSASSAKCYVPRWNGCSSAEKGQKFHTKFSETLFVKTISFTFLPKTGYTYDLKYWPHEHYVLAYLEKRINFDLITFDLEVARQESLWILVTLWVLSQLSKYHLTYGNTWHINDK